MIAYIQQQQKYILTVMFDALKIAETGPPSTA